VGLRIFLARDRAGWAGAGGGGPHRVELYTESYAGAFGSPREAEVRARFAEAARAALAAGLGVNAGHDLNRENLPAFLREVPGVSEVSIGHALIADALELGYAETIRGYCKAIEMGMHAA
jgi:pyridoxine 5-phosphate synthase